MEVRTREPSATLLMSRKMFQIARASSDIVVGAVGIPGFIKADWIKDGAVVVDAGFHKIKVNGEDIGIGDVDPDAFNKASAYTPVPGGVGPMTIATLIAQTLQSAELAASAAKA